jgi:hypothetical protein
VYADEDYCWFSDLDFVDCNTFVSSRGDGSVYLVDLRKRRRKPDAVYNCLDCPLKCLSAHPVETNYFAVGGNNG